MRVIRVIPNFYPIMTGPANQAFHISNELEKNNVRSPIITSTFGLEKQVYHEKYDRVQCIRFKPIVNLYQYSVTPKLLQFLMRSEYDLIHAHSYRNFQADLSYLVAKIKKKPFIINPHGQALSFSKIESTKIFRTPYRLYDLLTLRRVLRKADAIIAASKQESNEIKELKIEETKIITIPAGNNIEFPKKHSKDKSNTTTKLLFVGRISRNRRVEILLKAFQILLRQHKNVELWIVGGEERTSFTQHHGYLDELKRLSQNLHLSDKVHFAGHLPQNKLKDYYLNSDIFIYITDYENFGQTMLEAAAAGLPLICSPQGVAPEIIKDGKTGFLIKNEPKDIAEKIEYLVENRTERVAFGDKIRKLVETRYSWKSIIKSYMKLYKIFT